MILVHGSHGVHGKTFINRLFFRVVREACTELVEVSVYQRGLITAIPNEADILHIDLSLYEDIIIFYEDPHHVLLQQN